MPRFQLSCALMALPLVLSACTVGPDYKQPAAPLPAAFDDGATQAATPVSAHWWRLYDDAELTRVVGVAFKQSPTVEKALARIEEADAYVRQVGGNALPSVDAGGSASRDRHSEKAGSPAAKGLGGTYNTFKAGLTTTFELDFYGKLRRAREGARAEALASRQGADTVRITLSAQVAQTYFAIRSLEAQLGTTAQLIKDGQDSLALAQKRASGGASSDLDVAQAKAALAALAVQDADLKRMRALAGHRLALLCGAPDLVLAQGVWTKPAPLPPAGLPSDLLARRPDIQMAESQLKSANAAIGYNQAFKYPTFSISAALGLESRELSQFVTGGARTWSFGAGVYAPIFDGGQIDAKVDGAKARAKQAAFEYVSTVQTAFGEVRDALSETGARAEMAGLLAERQQAADEALAIAQSRYDGGYSPYLEVLDARRQQSEAKLALLRNREAQFAASVQLFKALGGGWRMEETK